MPNYQFSIEVPQIGDVESHTLLSCEFRALNRELANATADAIYEAWGNSHPTGIVFTPFERTPLEEIYVGE